jgi:hypothetical protein
VANGDLPPSRVELEEILDLGPDPEDDDHEIEEEIEMDGLEVLLEDGRHPTEKEPKCLASMPSAPT